MRRVTTDPPPGLGTSGMGSLVEYKDTHIIFGVGALGTPSRYWKLIYNTMKIIENNIIPFKGYKAITILNMIFVRNGTSLNEVDIRHEEIHWEQEKETLIVFYYLWYVFEFLIRFMICLSFRESYRRISFEMEAYYNQYMKSYLSDRKRFSWFKYV